MQKPISKTLPADLPENWKINDAVSPDGTDVGLSAKHGYNYQSKQINDAHTAINALNEAFLNAQEITTNLLTEAGLADADTVPFFDASANAHRKTTFGNLTSKIQAPLKQFTAVAAGGDLDDCKSVGMYSYSNNDSTSIANVPIAGQATLLVLPRLINYSSNPANLTQVLIVQPGRIFVRFLSEGVWGSWNESYTASGSVIPVSKGGTGASSLSGILDNLGILVNKYYPVTVARTSTGNAQQVTGNPIPTSGWIAATNKYVSGEYEIAGITFNDTLPNAVDGNNGTSYQLPYAASLWCYVKFPIAITVSKFKVWFNTSSSTEDSTYVLQGSNNGSDWTTLSTSFPEGLSLHERALTTTGAYQYYRILITMNSNAYAYLREFQVSEYTISTFTNTFTLANVSNFQTGQRILIETPSTVNSVAVISNVLNGKAIDTILQPSKRYELVYNGSSFNAKEVI